MCTYVAWSLIFGGSARSVMTNYCYMCACIYCRLLQYLVARPVVLAFIGGVVAVATYTITSRILGLKEAPKRARQAMGKVSQKKKM